MGDPILSEMMIESRLSMNWHGNAELSPARRGEVYRSHEALRRRLAEVEAERDELVDQVMRVQTSSEYDLGHDHGSAVAVKYKERAEAAEAERDLHATAANAYEERMEAAEDRVRTLTEAAWAVINAWETQPVIRPQIEALRAVLGSETSGEGTDE